MEKTKPTNRLIHETSPYLLQHAHNPVDWYPWGPEALRRALDTDTPIFLSVGYSSCHWCHVMEIESFEDPEIADFLNAHFVAIKVDREERPDLDAYYMRAVQAITGRGGWPLNVFLSPRRLPFYGGTYFPPRSRSGMPGFLRVLHAVHKGWEEDRAALREGAKRIAFHIQRLEERPAPAGGLTQEILKNALERCASSFDASNGGFGPAPKFPQAALLRFLLLSRGNSGEEVNALPMVQKTLDRMAGGGIHDQVGGGFHRYSVDERWLVPHFEKMLYDNALLSSVYIEAFRITKKEAYARTARDTLEYVLREMTSPEGGFYSSQDADTEGEEGRFYVWRKTEIEDVLTTSESELLFCLYDAPEEGNWEGRIVLNRKTDEGRAAKQLGLSETAFLRNLASVRKKLFDARSGRMAPGRDEKILVDWNGLTISALCSAARIFSDSRYEAAAVRAAQYILEHRKENHRLLHTRSGTRAVPGFLDDYAFFLSALIDLYETTFDETWLREAEILLDVAVDGFFDRRQGGFFITSEPDTELPMRGKGGLDSALPSGEGVMLENIQRMAGITGSQDYEALVEKSLLACRTQMSEYPAASASLLTALDRHLSPRTSIVVAGEKDWPSTKQALEILRTHPLPNVSLAMAVRKTKPRPAGHPLFREKQPIGGKATIYICEDRACLAPITDLRLLKRELQNRAE